MLKDLEIYIETIENENTRKAALVVIKKLDKYIEQINEATETKILCVGDLKDYDVESFIKNNSVGKSNTSILNTIAIIKRLLKHYNNEVAAKDLNLNYIRSLIEVRKTQLLTPYEVYLAIAKVENYQEKALILLIYMGLYDKQFDTIRNIKISDINKYTLKLKDGRIIELNQYCADILKLAAQEKTMVKYSEKSVSYTTPYTLSDSEYLLRTKARKGGNQGMISIPSLSKRMELISRVVGDDRLTTVNLKQSKVVYDLIKLEFEQNLGEDINQIFLAEYLKENNVSGAIGYLNLYKKELKTKIIEEIIKGKTAFIDKDC